MGIGMHRVKGAVPSGVVPCTFVTDCLRLQPLGVGDEALYVALYTDADTMRDVDAPLTQERAGRAFRTVMRQVTGDPPDAWYWTLALRSSREPMGIMALVPDAGRASAELGLVLPARWQGLGHASEAITALQAELLHRRGLDALWTRHRHGHAAAAGLMRRVGFRPDAECEGFERWRSMRAEWMQSSHAAVCDDRAFVQ